MYTTITNHIELDREQRSVRKDGQAVHLTRLEYGLLDFLSAHPNRICTRQMLDSVLTALLPSAQPGVLRLSSKLTMQHFILSLDLNGTINELRIPIYSDFDAS